jgi:nitric oxide reductase NorQ protein
MDYRESFAPLTSEGATLNIADELVRVIAIPYNKDAALVASAKVLPQGRYAPRAARGAAAPAAASNTAEIIGLTGAAEYLRPNGAKYYARKWGDHSDVAALQTARTATATAVTTGGGSPLFPLFYGNPGTGKTALVEAAFGSELYTLMGTGDTEVADLIGGYVQTASGGFEWVDGDLIRAAEEGKVYFIDEIGLIDPKVLSSLYGLMDGRREITITANPERGTVKAHANFFVVAATNPNAPGVRLSEALLSRFTLQVELTTDWALSKKLGVPAALVTGAQNLSKKMESGECSWAPQMRELLAFRDIEAVFGRAFAVQNLLAAAPELDRPVVADVLSRALGEDCKPARI